MCANILLMYRQEKYSCSQSRSGLGCTENNWVMDCNYGCIASILPVRY